MGIKYDARLHGKGANNGTNIFSNEETPTDDAGETTGTTGPITTTGNTGGGIQQPHSLI